MQELLPFMDRAFAENVLGQMSGKNGTSYLTK